MPVGRANRELLARAIELPKLVADRVVVLHWPRSEGSSEGVTSRDIDCAVRGVDPLWPLRLPAGWRLCWMAQIGPGGWFTVLEKAGDFVRLDVADDPRGLGPYGLPTGLIVEGEEEFAPPALRGAYLAVKRLRKGNRNPDEWSQIEALAATDWEGFRSALDRIAGPKLSRLLSKSVQEGRPLEERVWGRARALHFLRRFRSPWRVMLALLVGAHRIVGRAMRPTGWVVLVAGPDGAGKSTLSRSLLHAFDGVFRRDALFHRTASILPRPGKLLGRPQGDPAEPHARSPHGRIVSLALLAYHWLDFFLSEWLRIWPLRLRTSFVVIERGWWDLAVDPLRYRLRAPTWLVRGMGRLLPKPDMALVLEAPSAVLVRRKPELPEEELQRQSVAWRAILPRGVPRMTLDATQELAEVTAQAREYVLDLLDRRNVARLGAGWTEVRDEGATRWWLPRGPRGTARASLSIYQPVTGKARIGWSVARFAATTGAFRLLPRGKPPPRAIRRILAPHLTLGATFAVSRANHRGRYVVAIVTRDGRVEVVGKIATERAGMEALNREAEAITVLGPLLRRPLAPPTIIAREPGLLLLEAVSWRPRPHPWRLDEEVARALGTFFRSGRQGDGPLKGPAHGDFAPWNLLRTDDGWVLIDWESAMPDAPPLYDLCHFLFRASNLLHRPSRAELHEGLINGRGWVGHVVRVHAEAAGLSPSDTSRFLQNCLEGGGAAAEQRLGVPAQLRTRLRDAVLR